MSFNKTIDPLWALYDYYNVHQAAALIAGVDPNLVDETGEYFRDPETNLTDSKGITRVHTAFSLLANAIKAKTLPALIRYKAELQYIAGIDVYKERKHWKGENVEQIDAIDPRTGALEGFVIDELPDWREMLISRDDLIILLSRRGFRSEFFFPNTTDEPDYLDSNHPRYSVKLAAAVKAWIAYA